MLLQAMQLMVLVPSVCCSAAAGLGGVQQSGLLLSSKSLAHQDSSGLEPQKSLAQGGSNILYGHTVSAGLYVLFGCAYAPIAEVDSSLLHSVGLPLLPLHVLTMHQ